MPAAAVPIAASMHRVQLAMYAMHPAALHYLARCFYRTPDGFSRDLKAEHAETLAHARRTLAVLGKLLPREAANDPQPMPGAA